MASNKFSEAKARAGILEKLYAQVDEIENDAKTTYDVIRVTDEQDVHWKTGELLWEDEEKTIPRMKKEWGRVEKDTKDLTDEDRATIDACRDLKAKLEKLL